MKLKLFLLFTILFALHKSYALNINLDNSLVILENDLLEYSKSSEESLLKNNNFSFSQTANNVMQRIRLDFNSISGPGASRQLLLGFSNFTTDGYDYGYDAKNSDVTNNDLHLDLDGVDYNIQAYSPITTNKEVSLNFKSSGNNTFEIRVSQLISMDDDQEIYLKDNFTNTYFNLTDYKGYRFTSEEGVFKNRFQIVFQNEQQRLSAEISKNIETSVYYQNLTNSLFVKKLTKNVSNLSVVNMQGQIVLEMINISKSRFENGLQFDNISTGAYVVRLRTDINQVITKKILVN